MRFMMFMYPEISEEDWNPSADDVAAMNRYNVELREAGMLLALDGLRPPSDGAPGAFEGRGAGGAGRAARGGGRARARRAAAAVGRRLGRLRGARGAGRRRAVRRGQGGRRWLLDHPGALEGGGGRVGEALPRGRLPGRGAADLGNGGLLARGQRGPEVV